LPISVVRQTRGTKKAGESAFFDHSFWVLVKIFFTAKQLIVDNAPVNFKSF
jgi:hypothetical protein